MLNQQYYYPSLASAVQCCKITLRLRIVSLFLIYFKRRQCYFCYNAMLLMIEVFFLIFINIFFNNFCIYIFSGFMDFNIHGCGYSSCNVQQYAHPWHQEGNNKICTTLIMDTVHAKLYSLNCKWNICLMVHKNSLPLLRRRSRLAGRTDQVQGNLAKRLSMLENRTQVQEAIICWLDQWLRICLLDEKLE